jgi:hypothetical protein
MIEELEKECQLQNINFTKKNNHIRCFAHIINLSAQSALISLKANCLESKIETLNNEVTSSIVSKVIIYVFFKFFKFFKLIYNIIFIIFIYNIAL